MDDTRTKSYNVAEAKKNLSQLLGRVAFGGESILITRRGRPLARLVPVAGHRATALCEVKGWLDDDDPFFATVDEITAARGSRGPSPDRTVRFGEPDEA